MEIEERMAEIIPFRAIHYAAAQVGSLDSVTAPPYDVLSPEAQNALYDASPFNIVRIMLNRVEANDTPDNNPYTRAAGLLREWLAKGVLTEDDQPALYLYEQEFTSPLDGSRLTRTALFCALHLEPYAAGIVLPHEETRTKAKEDRLNLLRATHANTEPIFGLYEDPDAFVRRTLDGAAAADFAVTVHGDHHRVRRITEGENITAIQAFLHDRRVWIADGHHRYETSLAYRDERRQAAGDPASPQPYDYILIALVSFNDPGIVVLPTHRLVRGIAPGRLEQLTEQLKRFFTLESVPLEELPARMLADVTQGVHRFGMVTAGEATVLTLRDESPMEQAGEGHCDAWKRLDVSILQTLVLERSLGIPPASLAATPDVAYTRETAEALRRVQSGEFQIAFLLNLPTADEVRLVAAAGDKMPAKSTFFYPKLWSGLVLRSLDG
jgi:uncharacterized protein (DUF1015 family)